VLIGLRQLEIQLDQAADLATMFAAGPCDEVSDVYVDPCGTPATIFMVGQPTIAAALQCARAEIRAELAPARLVFEKSG
jgi:hypothetical protein